VQIFTYAEAHVNMERRQGVEGVVRALRRVNFQGSIFGQTIAIRLGLSESDIDALELLIDTGAATAGKLSEVMGLTTGAVTRVVDRLEQAGYVRRVTDPADRRRVVIEVVPERVATIESLLDSLERAAADEVDRYTPEQLATISDFLSRMADLTQSESARLRTLTADDASEPTGPSEHSAPLGGLTSARLMFRSGAQELRLRAGRSGSELYRARFDGATPQVRVRDGRVLVQYRGIPLDWRKRIATIGVNPSIPWTIEAVGGVNRVEADLREIDVRQVDLTGGSERIQVEFGRPHGEVSMRVVGGARTIRLERPADVPVRLRIKGGVGQVEVDRQSYGAKSGDVSVESRAWTESGDRFAVEIVGGVKTITVVERP
jgi:DNA-binding MarR family transcriptional regulator